MANLQTGDLLAGAPGIRVDQRRDTEPARSEPSVIGQRVAEITDPDDHHGPILGQADLTGNLMAEELYFVADTPRAVRTQVRQVLAKLRRVDPRRLRELIG